MTQLRKKAEELINRFVKNFILTLYPKVRYFRVGARCSKGKVSQAELRGSYHSVIGHGLMAGNIAC